MKLETMQIYSVPKVHNGWLSHPMLASPSSSYLSYILVLLWHDLASALYGVWITGF
jgi:hypothetical protein